MTNNDTPDKDCLDPEINSKCCFFKVANAFLLIFVFLLSIVLAIYAPRVIRGNNLGFDYMGVIIAVLAILVTLLVGWNIFSTIKAERAVRHRLERHTPVSEASVRYGAVAAQRVQTESRLPVGHNHTRREKTPCTPGRRKEASVRGLTGRQDFPCVFHRSVVWRCL